MGSRLRRIKPKMAIEQEQFTLEGTSEEYLKDTVWVVAADMMNGGHPQVLGVYTNEEAAREHERAIRKNGGCTVTDDGPYSHPVASFWTYEKTVESDYGGLR